MTERREKIQVIETKSSPKLGGNISYEGYTVKTEIEGTQMVMSTTTQWKTN